MSPEQEGQLRELLAALESYVVAVVDHRAGASTNTRERLDRAREAFIKKTKEM